jgi:hypothetical protein
VTEKSAVAALQAQMKQNQTELEGTMIDPSESALGKDSARIF